MADKESEKKLIDAMESLMDLQVQSVAFSLADAFIERIEESAKISSAFKDRRDLMYARVIDRLQQHLDKIHGSIEVEK